MKEKSKIWIEHNAAWAVAVILAAAYWLWGREFEPATPFKELAQAALNVAAISVGFLVSSKTILLSLTNSRVVKRLRASGHFGVILGYFVSAIWWSIGMAISSAVMLLFDFAPKSLCVEKYAVLAAWVFILGGTLGANARVIYLFGKLVRETAEPIAPEG